MGSAPAPSSSRMLVARAATRRKMQGPGVVPLHPGIYIGAVRQQERHALEGAVLGCRHQQRARAPTPPRDSLDRRPRRAAWPASTRGSGCRPTVPPSACRPQRQQPLHHRIPPAADHQGQGRAPLHICVRVLDDAILDALVRIRKVLIVPHRRTVVTHADPPPRSARPGAAGPPGDSGGDQWVHLFKKPSVLPCVRVCVVAAYGALSNRGVWVDCERGQRLGLCGSPTRAPQRVEEEE
jgi:hypothetical protein